MKKLFPFWVFVCFAVSAKAEVCFIDTECVVSDTVTVQPYMKAVKYCGSVSEVLIDNYTEGAFSDETGKGCLVGLKRPEYLDLVDLAIDRAERMGFTVHSFLQGNPRNTEYRIVIQK